MATVIDSFVVKLGLNNKEFKEGIKETDSSIKEVSGSITKFLAIVGGAAALKHFASDLTDANAQLARLSQNLGVSAKTLSAWGNAAELAGGSAEGLQSTFDMLSRSQTELELTGNTGILPYLSMLGVSFNQAGDHGEMLLQISDRIAGMDRTKANNILRGMGIDQGTANLLLKTRPEVEKMLALQKMQRESADKQADASIKLEVATTKLKQSIRNLGYDALEKATPYLEKFVGWLEKFSQWVSDHGEFTKAFLTSLGVALMWVQRGAMAAAIGMGLAIAPLLLFAAALALAWDDYKKWKEGGDSLLGDNWGKGIDIAIKGLRWMSDLLEDIVYRAFAAADAIGALVDGDWKRAKYAAGQVLEGEGRKYGERPQEQKGGEVKAGGLADGESEQKADFMMRLLIKNGMNPYAAAGMAANFQRESNFNPAAVGDNGKAYGIGQWHPDRQAKFKEVMGFDIRGSSIFDQAKFAVWETQNTEKGAGSRLAGAGSASEAGAIASKYYERPADVEGEARKRGALADMIFGRYGTSAMAATGTIATPAGGSNVNNTIGEIKVYTAATDATGIASDIGSALDYSLASQANYGLN